MRVYSCIKITELKIMCTNTPNLTGYDINKIFFIRLKHVYRHHNYPIIE